MEINLYNVGEKIFSNSEIKNKLPFFKPIFDQWKIAQSVGGMGNKIKLLEIEFLNSVNEEHKKILEHYFLSNIIIKKINNNLSENYKISMKENLPKEIKEYREFCVSTDNDNIYLTLWR